MSSRALHMQTVQRLIDEDCFYAALDADRAFAWPPFRALLRAGHIAFKAKNLELASRHIHQALEVATTAAERREALAFATIAGPYDGAMSQDALNRDARDWARLVVGDRPRPRPPRDLAKPRLTIGYASHQFGLAFDLPFLGLHDRSRFRAVGFRILRPPLQPRQAAVFAERFDGFSDLGNLPPAEQARTIERAGVDILVDLDGLGHNQSNEILGAVSAPVKVAAMNRFASADALADWTLGDAVFRPGDLAMPFMPIAVPTVGGVTSASRPLPWQGHGRPLKLCSPASLTKVNDGTIALWSRVLEKVPGSVFIYSWPDLRGDVPDYIRGRFAGHGIAAERIELRNAPSWRSSFEVLAEADLALDSMPFSSNFTALQCMQAGIPLVTLPGRTVASRFASVILGALGREELIADSADGFVRLAVALAGDADRRARYRRELPGLVATSGITDQSRLIRALEDCYRAIWETEAVPARLA